jgi:hypothetical protein
VATTGTFSSEILLWLYCKVSECYY